MSVSFTASPTPPLWLKAFAAFGMVFGIITLFSASSVLFGPESARTSAGNYLPFVVWFNFIAGMFYIPTAVMIWLGKYKPAFILSTLIALGTALTAALFARHIYSGGEFEMRTAGALVIRTGFWTIAALLTKNR